MTPFLPTCPRPASNWGLMRVRRIGLAAAASAPGGAMTARRAGRIFRIEMNETSMT